MVHGTVRHFFRMLAGLGLVLFLVAPLLAWRISTSPLRLDFLAPYIEDALARPDAPFQITLEGTELAWAGWKRSLDVRAVGVRMLASDGRLLASVPDFSLSLSLKALWEGVIAPRSIILVGARLHLVRGTDGSVTLGLADADVSMPAQQALTGLFEELLAPAGAAGRMGYLTRIGLANATVTIEDRARHLSWEAKEVAIEMRRDPWGIGAAGGFSLAMADGAAAHFDLSARYAAAEREPHVTLRFAEVRPAALAGLLPDPALLAGTTLPLTGKASATFSRDWRLEHAAIAVEGGPGTLVLPEPLAATYQVGGLRLVANVGPDAETAELNELWIDLGGPKVWAAGTAVSDAAETRIRGEAAVSDLPIDLLPVHWPASIAPKPRAWIRESLHDGRIPTAHFTASLRGPDPTRMTLEQFRGDINLSGITVDYLTGMPPARNVDGHAVLLADRLEIEVHGGGVQGLKVPHGTILIDGLDKEDQFCDIDLAIAGSLTDSLKLVDSKPLGYATALGLKPAAAGGQADTRLRLKFPVATKLKLNDVAILAGAKIRGLALPDVALGRNLGDGVFDLTVDNRGLRARGTGTLGGVPLAIDWQEQFGAKAAFRSRYVARGVLDDRQRAALGLDFPPLVAPFMTGPAPTEAIATIGRDGRGTLAVQSDLATARLAIPGLGWHKPAGEPAHAQATVRFAGKAVQEVSQFRVATSPGEWGVDVRGRASFDEGNQLGRVDFDRMKVARTDVAGTLTVTPKGRKLVLNGPAFDLHAVLAEESDKTPKSPSGPSLAVELATPRLWSSAEGYMTAAHAALDMDGNVLRRVRLEATPADGSPFAFAITSEGGMRKLTGSCEDAGALLRAMGIYDNMIGGKFGLSAAMTDDDTITGTAHVEDYRIVKAPLLARLLTVAALTGIVESLTGDGLRFTRLDMPFVKTPAGLLSVSEVHASGPSLGLTAKGKVHLDAQHIELEGTVVPAYAINSLLGKLPLVGTLFTAEKGGGIFAATYSMTGPLAEPAIAVNPLAVLAPGVLRKLFDVFETEEANDKP